MRVVAETPGADANLMRQLIDQMRKTASPVAVLLASREDDKVTIVAGISRDLQARGLDAGKWIRGAAEAVGGKGGGKPDMAQAGGKHPEKLPAALDEAPQGDWRDAESMSECQHRVVAAVERRG